jgi:hypothetical protein
MRVSLGVCGYRVQAQNTFDRDGIRPPTSSTWGSLSGILRIVGDTEDAIACGSVSTQLAYNASACEDPVTRWCESMMHNRPCIKVEACRVSA